MMERVTSERLLTSYDELEIKKDRVINLFAWLRTTVTMASTEVVSLNQEVFTYW